MLAHRAIDATTATDLEGSGAGPNTSGEWRSNWTTKMPYGLESPDQASEKPAAACTSGAHGTTRCCRAAPVHAGRGRRDAHRELTAVRASGARAARCRVTRTCSRPCRPRGAMGGGFIEASRMTPRARPPGAVAVPLGSAAGYGTPGPIDREPRRGAGLRTRRRSQRQLSRGKAEAGCVRAHAAPATGPAGRDLLCSIRRNSPTCRCRTSPRAPRSCRRSETRTCWSS